MLKKFFLLSIILTFTISTLLGVWIINCKNFLERTFITYNLKIEKNEPFTSVYNKIFTHLKTPVLFKYYLIKVHHFDKKIKYGTYKFENISINEALNYIINGKTYQLKITIPEGYNIYDIANTLDKMGIVKFDTFAEKCLDSQFASSVIGINVQSAEGFLYPETYFFDEDTEPEKIIEKMVETFFKNLPKQFEEKAKNNGLTVYEAVILASIIQKESYYKDELPLISSVFHNRLKKRMRLESDPTIIYGIYENFDGNIRKKDLIDKSNIYNTYKIFGLPPTPICNPDKYSLEAAVNPAKTDYLYFVADKEGKHHFSKTYAEHSKKVYKFQKR
ncbi:MAG: aminodeoxychorismate lyase [Deferribacteraceae bacterium]|nr:aminodeoxychorismate lyase [Deferribacteraceae bacterium]